MTPADIVAQLEATTKRTEKEAIIKAAWDSGCFEFFEGVQMAYDALRTYGQKKIPFIEGEDETGAKSELTWVKFKNIAEKLERRELTGNTARDALRAAANICSVKDWNGWYRRILLKDIKAGITDKTVNKILEKAGAKAKDYIIPVFSCQLAKNGEDYPKKLAGPKLVDIKLDGVRLLTVLDIEKQTVVQYTREGRVNDRFSTLTDSLARLLPHLKQSIVLDGEVISQSFQDLMKQVNRKKNIDTSDAKLALFDIVPLADFLAGECEMTQKNRHDVLVGFLPLLDEATNGKVYVIPKMSIDLDTPEGQAQLKEFNREALEADYEGIMIKDPNASYQTKRTDAWLKVKPWRSFDLEVIALEEGEGKFTGMLGAMVCQGVDEGLLIKTNVGSGFSDEQRRDIWNQQSKVIGQIVEIKADVVTKASNGSDFYSLRFPTFLRFRSISGTIGEKD